MRRVIITIALCLLALTVCAEEWEEYGDWTYAEVAPTLMDAGYAGIIWADARQSIAIFITGDGLVVIIKFGDYIAGGGEAHKSAVTAVSDVTKIGTLPRPFLTSGGRSLVWRGAAADTVLTYFHGASVVMLRTSDYRGARVDFAVELIPEDLAAAWARLTDVP